MRRPITVLLSLFLLLLGTAAPAAAARTTVDCDAGGDLQRAIDAARRNDTLRIAGTCAGNFTVGKDLKLEGKGRSPTLDGVSGFASALHIATGAHVRVVGLTIRDSIPDDYYAGGIHNEGRLLLRDSIVTENRGRVAGDILNEGRMTIVDSEISNGWSSFRFGGIVNRGTMTIRRSLVTGGSGMDGGNIHNSGVMNLVKSVVSHGSGDGPGGILNGGRLTIVRSKVVDNQGFVGIHNSGDLIVHRSVLRRNSGLSGAMVNDGTAVIFASAIRDNSAFDGVGGGIWNRGKITLRRVKFSNNTPDDCAGC